MQEDLNVKESIKNDNKSESELPYKNWKILWWDDDDKKHTLYTKGQTLDDVHKFCSFKGFKKFTIFDDEFINRSNDGITTPYM